ncbi:unnamed protein product, partial [Discosporangium mesarthrocarpum]
MGNNTSGERGVVGCGSASRTSASNVEGGIHRKGSNGDVPDMTSPSFRSTSDPEEVKVPPPSHQTASVEAPRGLNLADLKVALRSRNMDATDEELLQVVHQASIVDALAQLISTGKTRSLVALPPASGNGEVPIAQPTLDDRPTTMTSPFSTTEQHGLTCSPVSESEPRPKRSREEDVLDESSFHSLRSASPRSSFEPKPPAKRLLSGVPRDRWMSCKAETTKNFAGIGSAFDKNEALDVRDLEEEMQSSSLTLLQHVQSVSGKESPVDPCMDASLAARGPTTPGARGLAPPRHLNLNTVQSPPKLCTQEPSVLVMGEIEGSAMEGLRAWSVPDLEGKDKAARRLIKDLKLPALPPEREERLDKKLAAHLQAVLGELADMPRQWQG